jgi:hypothetical protein
MATLPTTYQVEALRKQLSFEIQSIRLANLKSLEYLESLGLG